MQNKCPLDAYQCKNGKCIGLQAICNGNKDCNDGEDEENCGKYFDIDDSKEKRQLQSCTAMTIKDSKVCFIPIIQCVS